MLTAEQYRSVPLLYEVSFPCLTSKKGRFNIFSLFPALNAWSLKVLKIKTHFSETGIIAGERPMQRNIYPILKILDKTTFHPC